MNMQSSASNPPMFPIKVGALAPAPRAKMFYKDLQRSYPGPYNYDIFRHPFDFPYCLGCHWGANQINARNNDVGKYLTVLTSNRCKQEWSGMKNIEEPNCKNKIRVNGLQM